MKELYEKLYELYLNLNQDLSIGKVLTKESLSKIKFLSQVLDFICVGDPADSELLWIADHFENIINY